MERLDGCMVERLHGGEVGLVERLDGCMVERLD